MQPYKSPADMVDTMKEIARKIEPPSFVLIASDKVPQLDDNSFVCFYEGGTQHLVGTTAGWKATFEERAPNKRTPMLKDFGATEIISIDGDNLDDERVKLKVAVMRAFKTTLQHPPSLKELISDSSIEIKRKGQK